ncbi:MAG: hypothetical protein C0404_08530 [Verrucomicrobia bacterium]|nr:hypothetical protein [Verrucomicrobiota bacterium]
MKMFSHTKSLIALGLAFLGVIVTWFWFQDRAAVLAGMQREKLNIQCQITDASSYGPIIDDLSLRLKTLENQKKEITKVFAEVNHEGPKLVQAIVDAATACGVEMTSVSEGKTKNSSRKLDAGSLVVNVVPYEVSLKGSYSGLVRFLQQMGKLPFRNQIESMEIVAQGERASADEIEIALVVAVFSTGG